MVCDGDRLCAVGLVIQMLEQAVADNVLWSILPTFYSKLLRKQIPKAQKNTDNLTVFFVLLGYSFIKAERKTLMKLTPGRLGGRGPAPSCRWPSPR